MDKNKIKILYVIQSFGTGGAEKVVLDLANGLDKNKFHVDILVLSNESLESFNLLEPGIGKYALDFSKNAIRSLSFWILGIRTISNLFKSLKPDIIHTHTFFSYLFFLSIAFKLTEIKFLHYRTIHSAGFYYESQKTLLDKLRLISEKISMSLSKTYLISVSQAAHQNNLIHFGKITKDIRLIPNGINLKKFNKINYATISKSSFNFPNDCLIITYVARLEDGKNHDFLIDLWPDVINQCPHAILCFAGDGLLKESLFNKAKNHDLLGSIYFFGSINNVAELLSITDIGVFPSSFEGFSLVMLEKFAMKLPVVASDIKPFHEIATNNISAFLVSIKEKEIFANKIVRLCMDASLREEMGKNAYSAVQKYSICNAINSHEKYYANFLCYGS